jgi:hypothetical protein
MPERTAEEIRKELAAERRALADNLAALRFRLRWYALFPVLAALIRRKGRGAVIGAGLRAARKLI